MATYAIDASGSSRRWSLKSQCRPDVAVPSFVKGLWKHDPWGWNCAIEPSQPVFSNVNSIGVASHLSLPFVGSGCAPGWAHVLHRVTSHVCQYVSLPYSWNALGKKTNEFQWAHWILRNKKELILATLCKMHATTPGGLHERRKYNLGKARFIEFGFIQLWCLSNAFKMGKQWNI